MGLLLCSPILLCATQLASGPALDDGGDKVAHAFRPIFVTMPEAASAQPLPDFPRELRRSKPLGDVNQAAVYTVNEWTRSEYGVDLARKVGSDVLIRGWFKWAQAPPVHEYRSVLERIHELGVLFGGGITCSALYDGENGISREQLLDMATRGPDGNLVDAWGTPGIRHGSLSSPAYLDYLFRWCREQIDAGADYLFLDEHTAALGALEGYDDHSLTDFRRYLLEACPQTRGWSPSEARWKNEFQINLPDPTVCPSGDMTSFDYRAYLRSKKLIDQPFSPENPLHPLWEDFRSWRDDRAWKSLTDRIRAYAREKGLAVLISANGIARYVDLQVLGVWGQWAVRDGHIDLRESQLPYWRSLVVRGREVAGKKLPVVLFHDWGFGDPPFPWLAVPPPEREVWMRTRGAEIYAAGGFFAFPVLGPFGCDAGKDGTLGEIARQTAFYQRNRDLYLSGTFLCSEALSAQAEATEADGAALTLAAWWSEDPRGISIHAINRKLQGGRLVPRHGVVIHVPADREPEKVWVISPDWEGERCGSTRRAAGNRDRDLDLVVGDIEAYTVAVLVYSEKPDLSRLRDPQRAVLPRFWGRPQRSEFRVDAGGHIEGAGDLSGMLQGMLHRHLRNPPTFLANAVSSAELVVRVRAVAALGARIECRVDGEVKASVDLPDRDKRNDESAPEYDSELSFSIPSGRHRITLDNTGPDWAALSWLEFRGRFLD